MRTRARGPALDHLNSVRASGAREPCVLRCLTAGLDAVAQLAVK